MRLVEAVEGVGVTVNGCGDLAVCYEARQFIGSAAKVIKKTKSGLVQIKNERGQISLPARNLDLAQD